MSQAIIHVDKLLKIFRSHRKEAGLAGSIRALVKREYNEYRAVDEVSFSIEPGECVGMLGANGAGKTTTLKILSGLLHPDSGKATVMGYVPWERHNDFRRSISIVMGQRNQLWWDLPAADSFLLNKQIYSISDADFKQRLHDLATALDVEHKLQIQLRRLSLGERMKCELIGALLHAPKVVFLDEPTIGLDVVAQHALRSFVAEFNEKHETTIILTSHYMDDIKALCQRVILIDKGRILYDGSLSKLVEKYVDDKVLSVSFANQVEENALTKFGLVKEFNPERVVLQVARAEVASVAAELLQQFPVSDLNIEEIPIEDVIRTIFNEAHDASHS